MKKSIISFICGMMLCLLLMPTTVHAARDLASGSGWYLDADGCLHITGAVTNDSTDSDTRQAPWYGVRLRILSVVTEPGASVDNCIGLFDDCSNLKSVDLSNLNTSDVTSMRYMFSRCENVTSINLSGLNTSNVTDMCGVFDDCASLASLDVSSFDTTKVTDMFGMFWGCKNLEDVDVSGFNTSKVTNMYAMFHSCISLTHVDVSGFDTSKVTTMQFMFWDCGNLMSIDVGNFITTATTEYGMDHMFERCSSLAEISITKTLFKKNEYDLKLLAPWSYKDSNEIFSIDSMTAPKATLVREAVVPDLNGWYVEDGCLYITGAVNNKSANTLDYTPWRAYKSKITSVVTLPGASVNNGRFLFRNCEKLVSADLSNLDTSSLTTCRMMFYGCSNLYTLNLSGFDTTNVTDMSFMFSGCKSLRNLDLSCFDTKNVTNMGSMFDGCEMLMQLNISSFNTASLTSMVAMFSDCSQLQSLDLSNFNTSSVRSMEVLFKNCYILKSIDLSSFDTHRVSNMKSMFEECISLTSLDLSTFDMSSRPNVDGILEDCRALINFTANADVYSYMADSLINISTDWKNASTDVSYQTVQDFESISRDTTITRVRIVKSAPEWYLDSYGCLHIIGEMPSCERETIDGTLIVEHDWNVYVTPVVTIIAEPGAGALDCYKLFGNSPELVSVDLVELDISKATRFSDMFDRSDKLSRISAKPDLFSAIAKDLMKMSNIWVDTNDGTLYMSADAIKSISKPTTLSRSFIQFGEGWFLCGDGTLLINGEVTNKSGVATDETPWRSYKNQITSVVTFPGARVDNAAFLFANCPNLTEVDLSKLDTSSVQTMRSMFENCTSLTTLDVNSLDTRNVTNMTLMFSGCSALETLDVSLLNTSNVTNFNHMFINCSKLSALDVSGFRTAKAESMANMFAGCSRLEVIDLTGFDTANVTSMSGMFNGCSSVRILDLRGFDFGKVAYVDDMFTGCIGLYELDINSDIVAKVASQLMSISFAWFNVTDGIIYSDEESLKTITGSVVLTTVGIVESGNGWALDELGNLFITGAVTNQTESTDKVPWKDYRSSIITVIAKPGASVNNGRLLFNNCTNLKTLEITELDISGATSVVDMIGNCSSLNKISANPAIITALADQLITLSPNWMNASTNTVYSSATALEEIKTNVTLEKVAKGDGWYLNESGVLYITGAVTNPSIYEDETPWKDSKDKITAVVIQKGASLNNADYLFINCPNLVTVDLSNLNASGIKTFYYSFANCTSLKSVNFGNIDTSNVLTLEGLFMNDNKLEIVNLSGINTEKVWQFKSMFNGCAKLKTVSWSNSFVTAGAKNLSEMFKGCSSLEKIDVSSFDTSNVTGMVDMFNGCSKLTSLDLSAFNVDKVTVNSSYDYMDGIFAGCASLKRIRINSDFLGKVASQIIALGSTWADGTTYKLYNTVAGLKALQGNVYLIKHVPGTHDFDEDGKCIGCGIVSIKLSRDIDIFVEKVKYDGNNHKPVVTVSYKGEELVVGTDYTIAVDSQKEAGKYELVITGINQYCDNVTVPWSITSNEGLWYDEIPAMQYTGKALKPVLTVYYGDDVLRPGKDYTLSYKNNTNAGLATITVKGKGNFAGSTTATFDIKKVKMEDLILPSDLQMVYTGKVLKPSVNITYLGKALKLGKEYAIKVENDEEVKAAKTYNVKLVGIGNFTGEVPMTLTVGEMKNADKFVVSKSAKQNYSDGNAIEPEFAVKYGKDTLTKGTDYEVSYKNNSRVGIATIVITGKNDYVGTKLVNFEIVGTAISKAKVTGLDDMDYTGKAITLSGLKLMVGDKTLTAGTDYTVSYDNNVLVGKGNVTITGKGGYVGTIKKTFKIKPYAVTTGDTKVTASALDMPLVKGGSKSIVTITFNGKQLVEGVDFTVSYKNNKAVTTEAIATVKFKGNFSGTLDCKYSITAADPSATISISGAKATVAAVEYDGTAKTPKLSSITIGKDKTPLKEGVDYKIIGYAKNVNKGNATVTIQGIDNYYGTKVIKFTIGTKKFLWWEL